MSITQALIVLTNEQYSSQNCAACGRRLQQVKGGQRALSMRDVNGRYVLPHAQRKELEKKLEKGDNVIYGRGRACCCKNCHAPPPGNPASPNGHPLGVNRDENAAVNILIAFLTCLTTGKLRYDWRHADGR